MTPVLPHVRQRGHHLTIVVAMLAALTAGAPAVLWAQNAGTVIVRAGSTRTNSTVEVVINGERRLTSLGGASEVRVVLPAAALAEGPASVRVVVRTPGFAQTTWTNTLQLNGSGVLEYTLNADGTGAVAQWPAVAWLSSAGALDVLIDGTVAGTTTLRKSLVPGQSHTMEWQRSGTTVCTLQVTVPYNVTRTYTCDVQSKKVTSS